MKQNVEGACVELCHIGMLGISWLIFQFIAHKHKKVGIWPNSYGLSKLQMGLLYPWASYATLMVIWQHLSVTNIIILLSRLKLPKNNKGYRLLLRLFPKALWQHSPFFWLRCVDFHNGFTGLSTEWVQWFM